MMTDDEATAAVDLDSACQRDSERRQARRYRFLDRRTGYDRRREYPITDCFRDDPLRLLALLVIINGLSALDFLFTWMEIKEGAAQEANPVLAHLFAESPGRVWLFKSLVMLAVSLLIWHQRKMRVVLSLAVAVFFIYAALVGYHISVSAALGLG